MANYQLSPDRCPSDPGEIVDDYCRNQLSPEEVRIFEEHYLVCPRCAGEVVRTRQLMDALRRLEKEK